MKNIGGSGHLGGDNEVAIDTWGLRDVESRWLCDGPCPSTDKQSVDEGSAVSKLVCRDWPLPPSHLFPLRESGRAKGQLSF